MIEGYQEFLKAKIKLATSSGFKVDRDLLNPALKPFTRDIVEWSCNGGRRAVFSSFGLHKTVTNLETMRIIGICNPGIRIIGLPLGVKQEFFFDALEWFKGDYAIDLKFIQSSSEIDDERKIYLTNYEPIRDGKLDVTIADAIALDEADCLRSFGSKTFGEFLFGPMQSIAFRHVYTATPSPNNFQELIAYAHFLGIMDIGESRTRFFKRNPEKADELTLHPHKLEEFWKWVASWAVVITKPSDLGYSDEGYILPELDVRWHEIPTDHSDAGETKRGQKKLLKDEALGVTEASREKRVSLPGRMAKMMELRAELPNAHRIIWHDLEDERKAIEGLIPTVSTVYGSQKDEPKEAAINGFRDGAVQELAAKPVMLGGGCNFQKHCWWEIFTGIGFKFRDAIQAIHRVQRFGQVFEGYPEEWGPPKVRIDFIYTEAERKIKEDFLRKWKQHDEFVAAMTGLIRQYGLNNLELANSLSRSMGVERLEESGEAWQLVKNDAILEAEQTASDSIDMILTSIPFSTQYEYTPAYEDFGHTDTQAHFFEQMDFLTPNLLRILKPGRIAAVHVKDRIVPGNMTSLQYPTVEPFHAHTMLHFLKHGFTYIGMITVTTDVVRENNQTYRLGWTEQCKDGSVKGVGMPEYILLFRRPPSDRSNGYADEPVRKEKSEYRLAKWQVDAHAYWRSNGNRYLTAKDLKGLNRRQLYRLWRANSLSIYDFDNHVEVAEILDDLGMLPTDFALLPVHSWNPDVWTDVFRAGTLNNSQSAKGREKHICPLQLDLVDRLIERYSSQGDVVLDPFSGIGTTVARSVKAGRFGRGWELNGGYWSDSIIYAKAEAAKLQAVTLFDLLDVEAEELEEVA